MKSLNTTFENQQKKEANKQQKVTPLKFNIDTKHGHMYFKGVLFAKTHHFGYPFAEFLNTFHDMLRLAKKEISSS